MSDLLPRPVNGWAIDRTGRLVFNQRHGTIAGMPWCDDLIIPRADRDGQAYIGIEAHLSLVSALHEIKRRRTVPPLLDDYDPSDPASVEAWASGIKFDEELSAAIESDYLGDSTSAVRALLNRIVAGEAT